MPVQDLITGFMSTVPDSNELITAMTVPLVEGYRGARLRYTPGRADDYPTVGVAAAAALVDGVVTDVSVAVGGAGPRVYSVPEAQQLVGLPVAGLAWETVADAAARRADPVDDRLGSAAYKRAMASVWVSRALSVCFATPLVGPKDISGG